MADPAQRREALKAARRALEVASHAAHLAATAAAEDPSASEAARLSSVRSAEAAFLVDDALRERAKLSDALSFAERSLAEAVEALRRARDAAGPSAPMVAEDLAG